ncbi:D-tyrosyl-tRNA(Tyr) deacylase 1 [Trichoplax sp. H2]|nr:D-tyrosyl-tRNA(Tyr) deacylase 1 [Trichoplax sp. H2]|eukprot:RDD39952.1 D-tyrosyl-tRNA(Tyr) deacylase 1 [Trichoplax sp. H2]
MKALVQRVTEARVTIGNDLISSIGPGLVAFIGIGKDDSEKDIDYLVKRLLTIRVFNDEDKLWERNVKEMNYEILCVSQIVVLIRSIFLVGQYTLIAAFKGAKPAFNNCMPPEKSKELFEKFLTAIKSQYLEERIKSNIFGSTGQVSLVNDGPTTFSFESLRKHEDSSGTNRRGKTKHGKDGKAPSTESVNDKSIETDKSANKNN